MFRVGKLINKVLCSALLMSFLGSCAVAKSWEVEASDSPGAEVKIIGAVSNEVERRNITPQQKSLELRLNGAINIITDVSIEPARRMRGKEFEWDHKVWVALPPSYHKTNKSYPVLWVTDGFYSFDRAIRLVYSEIRQHIPEMIVVGVGIPLEELEHHIPRRTYEFTSSGKQVGFEGFGGDLLYKVLEEMKERFQGESVPVWEELGGASKFLDFLVDEVRPALAQDYRMGHDHTLFGHSGGGYFCTYALFARTEAFSKYICSSPNLYGGNYDLFHMEEGYSRDHQDMKVEVFFGSGEAEMFESADFIPAWGIVSSMARMVEILRLRKYPSLKLHVRIFQGEDHTSVIPMNLGWGLRTLWQD